MGLTPRRIGAALLVAPMLWGPAACAGQDVAASEGCERLLSAIGFAEPFVPSGSPTGPLPSDVRGHIADVEGTVVRFDDAIPHAVHEDADRLRAAAADLTSADVPVDELPERLSSYRDAADVVLEVCGG